MCIPIYVFVFAIYYSVSAFVGLLYRSAILSVVAAILFWAFCFVIGLTHGIISGSMETAEPAQLVVDGGEVVKMDRANRAAILSPQDKEWVTAFQSPDMDAIPGFMRGLMPGTPMLGLKYDEEGSRFVGAQVPFGELGTPFSTNRVIVTASSEDDWVTESKMKAPPFTRAIFQDQDGSLIFVTFFGKVLRLPLEQIEKFEQDRAQQQAQQEAASDVEAETVADTEYFTDVSPGFPVPSEEIELIGWDRKTRQLAFFGNGRLTILSWNGEQFEWGDDNRYGLPTETAGAAIALGGNQAYIGVKNESLFVVELDSGQVTDLPWPSDAAIVNILTDPNGARTVILDSKGRLWQLVQGTEKVVPIPVRAQGKIRAVTYGEEDRFWTIDAYSRVHAYGWSDGKYLDSAIQRDGDVSAAVRVRDSTVVLGQSQTR